jgi:hypothetical protein
LNLRKASILHKKVPVGSEKAPVGPEKALIVPDKAPVGPEKAPVGSSSAIQSLTPIMRTAVVGRDFVCATCSQNEAKAKLELAEILADKKVINAEKMCNARKCFDSTEALVEALREQAMLYETPVPVPVPSNTELVSRPSSSAASSEESSSSKSQKT